MSVTLITFEGARYQIEDVRRMLGKVTQVDLRPDPVIVFDCYGRAFRLEPWEEITLPRIPGWFVGPKDHSDPIDLISSFGLKLEPWVSVVPEIYGKRMAEFLSFVAPEPTTAKLTKP